MSDSESTSRLRGNQPFEVSRQIPDSFLLKHIAGRSNLRVAWNHLAAKGGQAVGTDGISFDISSSMAWRVVRHLEEDVLGGTYRPGATREVRIPRPGKTDRVIEIPNIRDRVIGKAIASALRPVLAPVLTRFYGVGREHIFARMKVEAEVNNRFYIVQDDIRNCYPTANRETVMNVVRQSSEEWCIIDMPTEEFGLTDLIHRIVYGQDENQSTGLIQGGTLSPALMELLLHNTVDAAFHAASSTNMTLHRYVDDLCVQAQSPSDALEAMDMTRNQVIQNGQTLKGTSTGPIDLRTNSSEETVLGLLPGWDNGQLTFSPTDSAWQHLRELLVECLLLAIPHRAVTATINGWINSIAAGIRGSEQDVIKERIMGILVDLNIEPGREINIPETTRQASLRWQNLVTQTRNQLNPVTTRLSLEQPDFPQWASLYGVPGANGG